MVWVKHNNVLNNNIYIYVFININLNFNKYDIKKKYDNKIVFINYDRVLFINKYINLIKKYNYKFILNKKIYYVISNKIIDTIKINDLVFKVTKKNILQDTNEIKKKFIIDEINHYYKNDTIRYFSIDANEKKLYELYLTSRDRSDQYIDWKQNKKMKYYKSINKPKPKLINPYITNDNDNKYDEYLELIKNIYEYIESNKK